MYVVHLYHIHCIYELMIPGSRTVYHTLHTDTPPMITTIIFLLSIHGSRKSTTFGLVFPSFCLARIRLSLMIQQKSGTDGPYGQTTSYGLLDV